MSTISTVKARLDTWSQEDAANANNGDKARLRVSAAGGARKRSYIFFARPFPPAASIISATLRLFAGPDWSAGPHTLSVDRINQAWKESGPGHLSWNNVPTVAGSTATRVISVNPVNGEAVDIDVTAILQAVAGGATYHGLRIVIDTTGTRSFYAAESGDPETNPQLIVTWTTGPQPPENLSPSGDMAVSSARPYFKWRFDDQIQYKVQIDDATDFVSPVYDSGFVTSVETAHDAGRNLFPLKNQTDVEAALGASEIVAIQTAVVARTTTAGEFEEGVAGVKATAHATNTFSGINIGASAGSTNLPPVVPGQQYVASARLKGIGGTPGVMIRLRWVDSGGAALSNSDSSTFTLTGAFATYQFSALAPASAAFVRVQILFPAAGATQVFAGDEFQFEIGTTASTWQRGWDTGLPDNTQRWWRVQAVNGDGQTSDWSDVASFYRRSKAVLAITSPVANFDDTSPVFVHTFTGRTQQSVQYFVDDLSLAPKKQRIYDSGIIATLSTSFTMPEQIFTKLGVNYKITLRVTDDQLRTGMPNDPGYVETSVTLQLIVNGSPTVVNTVSLVGDPTRPVVTVQWSRAVRPDYFAIRVNGRYTEQRLDPALLETSPGGSTYIYRLWSLAGDGVADTVGIEAVTLSAGKYINSNQVTVSANPIYKNKWLVCPELDLAVCIIGPAEPNTQIGEDSEMFFPIGRRSPVRKTAAVRGYEGSLEGSLADYKGITKEQFRDRLELIKADANDHPCRAIWRDYNVECVVGDMSIDTHRGDWYDVSVAFWQTGDFRFDVAEL